MSGNAREAFFRPQALCFLLDTLYWQPGKARLIFFASAITCQLVASKPVRLIRNPVPETTEFSDVALADSFAMSGQTRISRRSNDPFVVESEPRSTESWSRVRVVPAGFLFAKK
jgi:hypothetical protein